MDPIGLGGGLNAYGFAAGDPVNYSDPFGLWPPPVHQAMIADTFGYLGTDAVSSIQAGSNAVDGFEGQQNAFSFMHSMKAPGESNERAISEKSEFVSKKLAQARALEGAHKHKEALVAFGEAIHPLMDESSPFHSDANGNPKTWNMYNPILHAMSEHYAEPTMVQKMDTFWKLTDAYNSVFHKP